MNLADGGGQSNRGGSSAKYTMNQKDVIINDFLQGFEACKTPVREIIGQPNDRQESDDFLFSLITTLKERIDRLEEKNTRLEGLVSQQQIQFPKDLD